MNELQTFSFNNQPVRIVQLNNQPYFNLKDVCEVLDIKNHKDVVSRLNPKGVDTTDTLTNGGVQKMTYINESNLYKTIFQSRKEEAEQFTEWVTSEVLPAIRKNGVYLTDEKAYDITHNPQSLADLLLQAGEQLKQKEIIIQEMKPKALFADAVAQSDTSILVYDLAKLICQNGIKIGGNRLWTWLRENGFIFKHSCEPTQKSMEMKLFEVIERTVQRSGHDPKVTRTTRVTGKGQVYFINKFLESQKGEQIC
jgi:phage antirepressor protein